jgi:hypothetical protein
MTCVSFRSLNSLTAAGFGFVLLGTVSLKAQAQGNLTISNAYGSNLSVSLLGHTPDPFSVFAGSFYANLVGGPTTFPASFEAYCVDINSPAHFGGAYGVNITSSSSLSHGTQVSWMGNHALYLFEQHPGYTPNEQRAALQLGIWNTLYDTDNTISNGNFALDFASDPKIETLANLYLTDSAGKSMPGSQILDATGHSYQALINAQTPEPGTIAYLAILSGGSLSLLRRRKSNRPRK